MGGQYSFWQSFRRSFFCAGQRAYLGQLRALKGRSRTEDLGVKQILRRIYFKVCMFGFDSSTDCLLLSGSNLDASLTPQSKAALPDTAPTVRHHPTAPETRQPDSPTPRPTAYVGNKPPRASANPPASGGGTGPDLRPAPACPLINTPANYHPFPEWRNP